MLHTSTPLPAAKTCFTSWKQRQLLCHAFLLLLLTAPIANAQLQGRIAERPIGSGYVRNLNQPALFDYMQHLAKRLEVGQTMFEVIPSEQLEAFRSSLDEPINGASWFMVQGLLPSFETVYFQQVVDAADAKRLLEAQKKLFGNRGDLMEKGDGCYLLQRSNSWNQQIPEGQDPEEYLKTLQQQDERGKRNRNFGYTSELAEEDGKPVIQRTWVHSEFYRFHDELLFNSGFEELFEMDLPSRDSLTSSISSSNDLGVEAFFDRIPIAIKQLGWNMLNSTAGTQMQRRDGEEAAMAELRKQALGNGLEIVRSVMFDVQEANGWVRFATNDEQAVRAELNFETRRNSGLTQQLEDIAAGRSRFAPILRDDAATTVHTCIQLSEGSAELFEAASNWLTATVDREFNGDAAAVDAAGRIAESVASFGENRVLEILLKAGWTESSDGVFYGGLQVNNNPALLSGLADLIHSSAIPTEVKDQITLQDSSGREVLSIEFPEEFVAEIQRNTSLNLTHCYLMHQQSCLWFAIGSENAVQMLHQSVDRCESSGLSARTPLVSAKIDVERWLSYPAEEDKTGIAGLMMWLDRNVHEFPPSPVNTARFGRTPDEGPTPLLQRCLDLGGERSASFTLIADASGVRASARVGEAIANYYLARMIDSQDAMMKQQRRRQEQLRLEAEERRKKAEAN